MSARICIHNVVSIATERKTFDKPNQGCDPFTTMDLVVTDSEGTVTRVEIFSASALHVPITDNPNNLSDQAREAAIRG